MATTGVWTVNNPTQGTHYYPPSGYWFVPNASSEIDSHVEAYDSGGNPKVCTDLTAIVRNVTGGNDSSSFGGAYYAVSAAFTGPNGANVYTGGFVYTGSGVAKITLYMVYTGHAYDQAPNAPSSLSPGSGAVSTTRTPTFSGHFSDPDSGDTMGAYQIQVTNAVNGGGTTVWDSGTQTASSSEKSNAAFSRVSGVTLAFESAGSQHSWRARTQDASGTWGPYSGWVNFTVVSGPNNPAIISPSGIISSATPTTQYTYSSPTGLAQQSVAAWIYTSDGVLVWYNGKVANSVASGGTCTVASVPTLTRGQSYVLHIVAYDTNNAASSEVTSAFSVAALPVATATSPINNNTINNQHPTLNWSYASGYFLQASASVQVYTISGGVATLLETGSVSGQGTSYNVVATVGYGTALKWHVTPTDTAGLVGSASADAFFQVNSVPVPTITSPASLASVPTDAPTITWTYTQGSSGTGMASGRLDVYEGTGTSGPLVYSVILGASTLSAAVPSGKLINLHTYTAKVTVTDGVAASGTATVTFTVTYTPPADMQGQPDPNGVNYLLGPYLNTDLNSDGVADNWTGSVPSNASAYGYSIAGGYPQPLQRADGDGQVTGAQNMHLDTLSGASTIQIIQDTLLSDAGWVAGTTHVSASAMAVVTSGHAGVARIQLGFFNAGGTEISTQTGTGQGDTGGAIVAIVGPQNFLIPATTTKVRTRLQFNAPTSGDTGSVLFMDAQLEAASASTNYMAGDMGTGFAYDATHGWSVRTQIVAGSPSLTVNDDTTAQAQALGGLGGTITLNWDTTLADANFAFYLVERRRLEDQTDDTLWRTMTTIYTSTIGTWTDYSAGAGIPYQYAVRQAKNQPNHTTTLSQHRAIVVGVADFDATYLVNAADTSGAPVYNLRLSNVDAGAVKEDWTESATYTGYLGRIGLARDAGPDAGFGLSVIAHYTPDWGDDLPSIRAQLVAMKRLSVVWYYKPASGQVLPVYIAGLHFDPEWVGGGQKLTVTFDLTQARDTFDY